MHNNYIIYNKLLRILLRNSIYNLDIYMYACKSTHVLACLYASVNAFLSTRSRTVKIILQVIRYRCDFRSILDALDLV